MLNFKEVNDASLSELSGFYKSSEYKISDYSTGIKYMWRSVLYPSYAISHGCLVFKETYDDVCRFNFPMKVFDDADIELALDEIEEYCKENFIPFEFDYVPKEFVPFLSSRYDRIEIAPYNTLSDYIYLREDFASFKGKKYNGQRNHIKKFTSAYPNAFFKLLSEDDIPLAQEFFRSYKESFSNTSDGAYDELLRAEDMCKFIGNEAFICGGIIYRERLISFCLCEICGDMAINHIEKAFSEFEGLYPATASAFARALPEGVIYLNREDDAGIRGLRISKLQYKPCMVIKKYGVKIKNELSDIDETPRIFTNRLVLDEICKDDAKDYFRLSTDTRINKYWGYDYREACAEPSADFFFKDQAEDFKNRMALNLAIRYKGRFAGEVILYNFDYRDSSAEVGVRIFSEFDGKGIGNEAFSAACNYALYTLGLSYVKAKCYKENTASQRMLLKSMKQADEDDTFYYFRRKV